jgi:ABC-type anion transport system duplicated permease subunit
MLKPHGRLLGAVLKPHGRLLGVPGLSLLVGYHFAMLKPHGRLFNSVVNPTVGYFN